MVPAAGAVGVAVPRQGIPHRGAAVTLAMLQTLPLVFRRRPPWMLAVVAAASSAAAIISSTLIQPLSLLVL